MKKIFILISTALLLSTLSFYGYCYLELEKGHDQMCQMLKEDFLEGLSEQDFAACKKNFDTVLTFSGWEKKMNHWLEKWGWSHLAVYAPSEHNELWNSQIESVGAKLKIIQGEYVVYRAHPKSVLQKGDLILSVNRDTNLNFTKILKSGGLYRIERDRKVLDVEVSTYDVQWDDRVELKDSVLKVFSFRGEFFDDEAMNDLKMLLLDYNKKTLYLDLRNNLGGNIASGLRLLSLLLCEKQVVGQFTAPSRKGQGESDYTHDTDQSTQVNYIKRFHKVHLRVEDYGYCFKGQLKVLIDFQTASTAELVAQALKDFKRAEIIGEMSSGKMVLSSWEKVPKFPEGYYFSYPYAVYKSAGGSFIEGVGVLPDIRKTYLLDKEKLGQDSFINESR